MKNDAWPMLSFTEFLRPLEGWKTEHAILATYSADLVVVVTALLALAGTDLDQRRTGSRVELVRAVETLRGKVRVLAQAGRVTIPNTPRSILKLLDRFVRTIQTDESIKSWHPKIALVRCHEIDDPSNRLWRLWLGSRNLTRGFNWETGLTLTSRPDDRGQQISGLVDLAVRLVKRAELPTLTDKDVEEELSGLSWECPPATEVQSVKLLGSRSVSELPNPASDVDRLFVVSPFLDEKIVRIAAEWGNNKTRRTLVSTTMELQRLITENEKVFEGFDNVLTQPLPDLPGEDPEFLNDEPTEPEFAESEEVSPAGLHAKLIFVARRSTRQLWLGSPNATKRGWEGRNVEVLAQLLVGRDIADAIEDFINASQQFIPRTVRIEIDEDREALEQGRKLLSGQWSLRQHFHGQQLDIIAVASPPLHDRTLQLEVAVLGGAWNVWANQESHIVLLGVPRWQRTDFLQVRLVRGEKMCAWLQVAPCDPPPDEDRDRSLIAEYLDPRTFLLWLRSLLADEAAHIAGGDWDGETNEALEAGRSIAAVLDVSLMPTIEEILRAWAREPSAFSAANEKVNFYLDELENRAKERGDTSGVELLQNFERTWNALALELG